MSGSIKTNIEDGVCTMTLENEEKRNAISYPMMDAAIDELNKLEAREDDYVLVITGAGNKAFSAGFDLSQDRDPEKEKWWKKLNKTIELYEFPTIARINGDTYGGGIELISACDIRIGTKNARFGITPAKIGLVYSPEAITRVIRLVGTAKAKELLFSGNAISGEHACEIGLLNHVVATDNLDVKTYNLAATISSNAPISLKGMKQIISAINDTSTLSRTERKWGRSMRTEAFESKDYREGVEAFMEGRQPEFEGQ